MLPREQSAEDSEGRFRADVNLNEIAVGRHDPSLPLVEFVR